MSIQTTKVVTSRVNIKISGDTVHDLIVNHLVSMGYLNKDQFVTFRIVEPTTDIRKSAFSCTFDTVQVDEQEDDDEDERMVNPHIYED